MSGKPPTENVHTTMGEGEGGGGICYKGWLSFECALPSYHEVQIHVDTTTENSVNVPLDIKIDGRGHAF